MSDNTGGGKSTLVQAPQKTAAPVHKGTSGGGFIKASRKKKAFTMGDYQMPSKPKTEVKKSSLSAAPKNPYPKLTRNDLCGCGSEKKYKRCCLE